MKLPCDTVRDLLPLYCDSVCSEQSRQLVEEHLRECSACQDTLRALEEQERTPASRDELKPLLRIRAEWSRAKKRSLWKGILIGLLVVALLFGGGWCATGLRVFPVSMEKVQVTDVCRMEDGNIAFYLLIDDGRELQELSVSFDSEGTAYLTPKRALIENRARDRYFSLNDRYFYVSVSPYTNEYVLDPANEEEMGLYYETHYEEIANADFFFDAKVRKICIGTPKNHVVLWEEGMLLPAASEELEALYRSGIR